MQVKTFLGKVSVESLGQMDEHINRWLEEENVEPKKITQSFGYEKFHESGNQEAAIITSVWY